MGTLCFVCLLYASRYLAANVLNPLYSVCATGLTAHRDVFAKICKLAAGDVLVACCSGTLRREITACVINFDGVCQKLYFSQISRNLTSICECTLGRAGGRAWRFRCYNQHGIRARLSVAGFRKGRGWDHVIGTVTHCGINFD